MESDGLFRRALDTVFSGSIFLPATVIGRGGFSPAQPAVPAAVSPETLGITGRTLEALYYVCQGLPNKLIARNMGIEEGTVRKDYLPKLFRIFHVVRRTELMIEVSRRGIAVPKPERVQAAEPAQPGTDRRHKSLGDTGLRSTRPPSSQAPSKEPISPVTTISGKARSKAALVERTTSSAVRPSAGDNR